MNYGKDNHLNEDQFLLATVDKTELPAEAREHLSECPQCREQIENMERELTLLSRMAEDFAPQQRKRAFRYVKPRNAGNWIWSLRTASGAAVMVVLAVTLVWWSPLSKTTPEVVTGVTFQESDQLMADIDTLVDNALPPIHVYISGESGPELDEEFMEFVVPIINNTTPTYNSGLKGAVLC